MREGQGEEVSSSLNGRDLLQLCRYSTSKMTLVQVAAELEVFALADRVEGEERHVEEKRRDDLARPIIDLVTNRYTKLENLAWSQTVFLQFTFCRKRKFMKPLLLSNKCSQEVSTKCPYTHF